MLKLVYVSETEQNISTVHKHCSPASKCTDEKTHEKTTHRLSYCQTCDTDLCNSSIRIHNIMLWITIPVFGLLRLLL